MAVEDQAESLAGRSLGHYRLLSRLGRGGMGEVYLAEDARTGRKVALKVLPPSLTEDKKRVLRFQQEARAILALNHPNIVTIFEIGEADSLRYLATELVEGTTLREKLSHAALPLEEALDIAVQVATALAAAHEAGIIHRDIKPENIMVRRDRIVKVLDFGLAKLTAQHSAEADPEAPTVGRVDTEPGVVMGTVAYMSPEQARGLEVDERADVWSTGVVLYEMITGRLPFKGASVGELYASILDEREIAPLASLKTDAPAELERAVAKALRKDRNRRYQTINDFLLTLKNLKEKLAYEAKFGQPSFPAAERQTADTVIEPPVRPTAADARSGGALVRHKMAVAVSLVALVALAAAAYFYSNRGPQGAVDSIAVLPFVNTTADAEAEYLSDGLTESIINSLSQLSQLKVMARSTVFRYKGRETDPLKVGRELGVRAVLTGRVQQRDNTLSIQAELVDVATGLQLWGEHYNRPLSDIFTIQEEIARHITERLRTRLTGEEQRRVTKRYTENVEAYRLYLKGRFEWNKFSPEGVRQSIEYYNQALSLDPTYTLAYVGLCDSYSLQAHIMSPPRETYAKAKWAGEKALELDDTLAEAHDAVAVVKLFYEWDWPAAERELKRSAELNPNGAGTTLHPAYLKTMGRFAESIAAAKSKQEFDPLSPFIASELADAYYFARQYDDAITQAAKALEIDPHFRIAYHVRGRAFAQKGMYAEAVAEFQKWAEMGRDPQALGSLGQVYGASGQRDKALDVLKELEQLSKRQYVPSYWRAIVYVGLGDKDQAFFWLEKAYEERYFLLIWLRGDPRFDSIRSDPRYTDLLRRMKL